MIIKVCGLRDSENIKELAELPIDIMGFIFYEKSPRFVAELPEFMPVKQKRAGVFVNAEEAYIKAKAAEFGLDYIQLHGNESPDFCRKLKAEGYKLIKAFGIACKEDFEKAYGYEGLCELYVFDTKCQGYGGSGRSFDHSLLQAYDGNTPFLLSGGLKPSDAEYLKTLHHPKLAGLDLNSGFETKPGLKQPKLITELLDKLKIKN